MNDYFSKRATVRKFSKREVSDDFIKEMLEAASHAPTTGNMQLYSVVITKDSIRKQALAPAHFSQPAFLNAPVILTFCADFNRVVKWCRINDADDGFNNIQSFVAAALDAIILAQQFVTIAEMKGLGTCYLGTTTYNPQIIADILELPYLVVPITTVALGYPDEFPAPSDRLSVNAFVHSESYKDYDPEEIANFYKEKENLEESRKFISENNKQNLAQVYSEIRYPRTNNEFFSKTFTEFIRNQGFK